LEDLKERLHRAGSTRGPIRSGAASQSRTSWPISASLALGC
jgi:hypothetical protein